MITETVRIKKLDERAVIPTYGSEFSAGADLYAVLDEPLTIESGCTVLVHTGLALDNILRVKESEQDGFFIDFVNISEDLERIKSKLKDVYHFSVVTYYRMFIASLFPQYEKVLYLDCDIVVLGFVSNKKDLSIKAAKFALNILKEKSSQYNDVKFIALGPTPANVPVVSNKYRYRIILKTKNSKRFREFLNEVVNEFYISEKQCNLFIDINPESMI